MSSLVRTSHDLVDDHPALGAMAMAYGRAQRWLYVQSMKGRGWRSDLAKARDDGYLAHGLNAKQWEHCWRDLQGKVASQLECDALELGKLERRAVAKVGQVEKTEKALAKARRRRDDLMAVRVGRPLPDRPSGKARAKRPAFSEEVLADTRGEVRRLECSVHQHKRKLESLIHRLGEDAYEEPGKTKPRTLCFGGRDLFRQQHHLAENGFADHAAWKAAWDAARNDTFMSEGDARWPSGNEFARVVPQDDGTFHLVLRVYAAAEEFADPLPDEEDRKGRRWAPVRTIRLCGLRFPHGAASIRRAIADGRPLTVRLKREPGAGRKGADTWRVSVTVREAFAEQAAVGGSRWSLGALGIDLNAHHVTATLIDRHGNVVRTWRIPLVTHSRSETQNRDAARKAAAEVVRLALRYGVPVVSEKLDFAAKREALADNAGGNRRSRRAARRISSFASTAFDAALASACVRRSVSHHRVNPAFTSVIGDLCLARRFGLSVHAAAAAVVARRAMRLAERLPAELVVMTGDGVHVALPRPERIGRGHVWAQWRKVAEGRRAVLTGRTGPGGSSRPTRRERGGRESTARTARRGLAPRSVAVVRSTAGGPPAVAPVPRPLRRSETPAVLGAHGKLRSSRNPECAIARRRPSHPPIPS